MTSYQPPFTLTPRMFELVGYFGEQLGRWQGQQTSLTPMLRRGNRIRTIQASLAIEHNTLSLAQVSAVLEGKPVFGPANEIQEVRNAFAAYEKLSEWQPHQEAHLLAAHARLMYGLVDELGQYRSGGVGIYQEQQLVHMAPPASQVPRLMTDLLNWLEKTELPPLLASCLFYYEFEFIHPFCDGNGRLGRLWQTLILSRWRAELAWLSVETIIRDRQADYYRVLGECDQAGESTRFVEFMLQTLCDALQHAIDNDTVTDTASDTVKLDSTDRKILALLSAQATVNRQQLAEQLNLSLRTIQRRIDKLRPRYLERIGSDKNGHWLVKDDN